ncbi:DNA replication/repair protein RecF [Candidatus Izemoplasma sp. B36]|uniref:DNA replication/repair protein RecF n=1 Tax=Candidatus Izemoplasma sp. B36 TaxID=3242468 RepID=UPI00355803C7
MRVNKLELYNFRNYKKQNIVFSEGVNLFVGDNGSGKTNLLEAIYFLSVAKSYKTNDINTITYNSEFSRITAEALNQKRKINLKIVNSKKGKKTLINNKEIKKLSDYIGAINVLSFLPEDLMIIKGSPKDRRYFINLAYGQIDRQYLYELTNFRLLLKQRNELLKRLSEEDNPDLTLLDVITEQLSRSIELIVKFRRNFIENINHSLKRMYRFLSDKKVDFILKYNPSIENNIEKTLKSKYKNDIYLKTTNLGPHRDDFDFLLGDLLAKDNASQGEQRIMVLAVVLAISDIIENKYNERPIFLLDDVFSELDSKRQNKLIKYLLKLEAQAIITTTNLENIQEQILKKSTIFRVQNNTIMEEYRNGQL